MCVERRDPTRDGLRLHTALVHHRFCSSDRSSDPSQSPKMRKPNAERSTLTTAKTRKANIHPSSILDPDPQLKSLSHQATPALICVRGSMSSTRSTLRFLPALVSTYRQLWLNIAPLHTSLCEFADLHASRAPFVEIRLIAQSPVHNCASCAIVEIRRQICASKDRRG